MRIGCGYDAHRFMDGNYVMMGGVKIPYEKGVQAHSDGDVLLHAIGDALLGAATLGDMGRHFPDSDPAYRSISSSQLIQHIMSLLQKKKYRVQHIDSTVITEAPRLAKHIEAMRKNIATLLSISVDAVSVKATTNEKMGWIGQGVGLAAQAVVLLSI